MEEQDPVNQLRNNLNCSICLEVFSSPLTLRCGHTFCQKCIHEHWDREQGLGCFSCPECRLPFPERPEPQKNVSLSKVVDDVKTLERSRALVPAVQTGALTTALSLCQRHQQPLTFYCCTDSRCICNKCLLRSCQHHELRDLEQLSQQEKKKLSDDLTASDRQQKHTGEEAEKWKRKIENIKIFHEKIVSGIVAKFEQVKATLDACQILVVESVSCETDATLRQAADHVLLLENHLKNLEKHHLEAEMLLRNDAVAFLQGRPQLVPVGLAPESPNLQLCGNLQMEAVTKILPEVTRLLQQELPNLLHPEKPIDKLKETSAFPSSIAANDTCCVVSETSKTSLSEQKTFLPRTSTRDSELRLRLCKDYRNLKFDRETANKYIQISHDNCKATHKSLSRITVPNSPRRFQTWQVMCMEGFSEGSHYWEVGISTFFVGLGVAYGSLKRSKESENEIGRNGYSWSLQLRSLHQSVWHNNGETKLQPPEFRHFGIHLDLQAGALTFYGVKDGSLQQLHSFSCLFSEMVFPVFWIGEDVTVTIRTIPNGAVDASN